MSEPSLAADSVALIPAAGGGMRLGQGPKAFLQIGGQSLLQRVVGLVAQRVGRILVAVPADQLELATAQLEGQAEVHVGGATRLATIATLLTKSTEPLVIIHDAARPFTHVDVLTQVIEAARIHGAAVACRAIKVPTAHIENGWTKNSIPPSRGGSFETPQGFQRGVLDRTFQYIREHGIKDDALSDIVVRAGTTFRVVADTEWNFKITTPMDWEIATKVVAPMLWPEVTSQRNESVSTL
jgi:2-C-methyl-D-erythritol 4-phosphate cytidylyltransferase